MARRMLAGLCAAFVFAGVGFGVQPSRAAATPALLVFGAASLANVLDELGVAYAKESGQAVKGSYASSSVLARQLEAGAPADIFLSADLEWMDQVQSHSLIKLATRRNLLANRLVLVAPSASDVRIRIASGFPLLAALRGGRLAVGDPDSVPAGKYARAALLSLGVWNQVVDHLARGDSVRSALVFVARGEAPLGIVYETDALIEKRVKIVDIFPASSHPPIVYPAALTAHAKEGAERYLQFLSSPASSKVFARYGFTVLRFVQ